jgi:multisubunit Na+/H+ antiporter MnhF subunit
MRDWTPRKLPSRYSFLFRENSTYRPAIGRNIDIEEIVASDTYETSRTRDHLAKVIVWGGAVALAIAALASYGQSSFAPIAAVWAVLGPVAGGIVSYYFYRGPKG